MGAVGSSGVVAGGAVALVAGVLGYLMGGSAAPSESGATLTWDPVVAAPAETGELDGVLYEVVALRQSWNELEAAVRALTGRLDAIDPLSASRQPVSPSDGDSPSSPELDATLADVQFQLRSALALLEGGGGSLRQVQEEKPEPDWAELQPILELWRVDQEAALREVYLLSDEEMMRKYGPPTKIWGHEGQVAWLYGDGYFDPNTEKFEREIFMEFVDGHVNQLSVEE